MTLYGGSLSACCSPRGTVESSGGIYLHIAHVLPDLAVVYFGIIGLGK
jgi:hypothetical protein